MGAIEVRPVEFPRDAAAFCKAWWPINEGDPTWVPPLIFERKVFFDPAKNPYFKHAKVAAWMAFRDGKCLGTIAASIDEYQQETDPGVGLFGFFEFFDDVAVAQALFDQACGWLRQNGMKRTWGPFNFSCNHEFGLLVDGFKTPAMISNPHNRDYYPRVYEAIGLYKVMDWYAYKIEATMEIAPRVRKVSDYFLKRHPEVEIRQANLTNWDQEVQAFQDLYNDAWEQNWSHVHLDDAEFKFVAANLKDIIDPRLVLWAFVDGKIAGVCLTLWDYNQVAIKMNGGLFPFGWWHWLNRKSTLNQARVFVLGVKKEFQHLPLGAPMYIKIWDILLEVGVKEAECSLILENNFRMRGALEKMGAYIYKTYRSYEFLLVDGIERTPLPEAAPGEAKAEA